jgi:hypothetical protein
MEKQKLAVIALSVLGIAGTFLPWASLGGFSANGTDGGGDGYITLFFFGINIIIAVLGGLNEKFTTKSLIGVTALSALCSIIGLYDLSNFNNNPAASMASIGIGLYLIIFMGFAVIGAAFGLKSKSNTSEK